ncbi:MAG: enoyl-CoA hydratase-related protein [Syntrophaceae bacterium]
MPDTLFEVKDSIALITLNRAEKLNSVTLNQLEELIIKLNGFEQDDSVRAVLITATGRGFCTGADLSGGGGRHDVTTPMGMKLSAHIYGRICFTLATMEKPVIAAVNGIAAGSGCNLALSCDIIYAARSARFIQIFVKRGMCPDCGGTYFVPRLIGLAKAKELFFSGDSVDAQTALDLGMINKVVDDDQLMNEALAYAGKLAQMPTRSIGMIKRLLNRSFDSDLLTQIDFEAAYQGLATSTSDMREGWTSFFEKREPRFQGK